MTNIITEKKRRDGGENQLSFEHSGRKASKQGKAPYPVPKYSKEKRNVFVLISGWTRQFIFLFN